MTPVELYERLEADWRARGLTEDTMLALDRQIVGCAFVNSAGRRIKPHGVKREIPIDSDTRINKRGAIYI
jgi:hypothetical protein